MLIRGINYGSWSDDELRRALNADPEDVDAILESAERFRKQGSPLKMPTHVGDVCSGFPDEDFACHVLKRLRYFADTLKGSSKQECLAIVTVLEDLEQEIAGNVEYGKDELRKIENALAEYAESIV
jgi:hypothetical protein